VEALRSAGLYSCVLVGAQAVYLRTADLQLTVPPYTFDADLCVDPRRFPNARSIYRALVGAGFELRSREAGLFRYADAPEPYALAARVDILVPELFAHRWSLEGYRRDDAFAAMSQPGLELTLTDNTLLAVPPLEGVADDRTLTMRVAGPMSLLVAKGWKIGERYEQGPDAFAEVEKDVVDIYRLLVATQLDDLRGAVAAMPKDEPIREVARKGAAHVSALCTNNGAALKLLRQALPGEDAAIAVESLQFLARRFGDLILREDT